MVYFVVYFRVFKRSVGSGLENILIGININVGARKLCIIDTKKQLSNDIARKTVVSYITVLHKSCLI